VCGQVSSRVHSRYRRKLADLPWQGRVVSLTFWARRLHCADVACHRQIFTERRPDVAAPHARRTVRLGDIQGHLGAALGCYRALTVCHRSGAMPNHLSVSANDWICPVKPELVCKILDSDTRSEADQATAFTWRWGESTQRRNRVAARYGVCLSPTAPGQIAMSLEIGSSIGTQHRL